MVTANNNSTAEGSDFFTEKLKTPKSSMQTMLFIFRRKILIKRCEISKKKILQNKKPCLKNGFDFFQVFQSF